MMFSTTLPLLPPPSTSLLPPLHTPVNDGGQYGAHLHAGGSHLHQQQRRNKNIHHPRSSIHLLTLDERAITQRKMAIAMYGYSWLKPAGCTKTMLGRREEELEREEAERQLREVEMQERAAAEGEAEAEAERLAEMRRLELAAEANGDVIEGQPGERDLDDDIPEAEEEEEEEDSDIEAEDMDGDLDDDIPDADATGAESSWVYDTSRDPDTDSEDGGDTNVITQHPNRPPMSSHAYLGMHHVAQTEAMVNAMLNEDERDLDDDMPDMDMDMDGGERDLDDDVPEAASEGEWQHTDTELEESDMDISILPPAQSIRSGIGPGTTHEEMRRTSGNIMMPPPQVTVSASSRQSQAGVPSRWPRQRNITPQTRAQYHTPGIDTGNSVSNLISTDGSSFASTGARPTQPDNAEDPVTRTGRDWLNAASARRTLFGTFTRGTGNGTNSTGSGFTPDPTQREHGQQSQVTNSSSGLFTPTTQIASGHADVNDNDAIEEPRSRTRSGRLLGHRLSRGR